MKIGLSLPVREMKKDLGAIKAFAELAEELDFSHLRIPDQVIRPDSGHLHEPMTLLAWLAGLTSKIQLVPSVIVLPLRRTAVFAKQAAGLDLLCNGRLRLGIGVGANPQEFAAVGEDFHTRGARCDEQMTLLRQLWTNKQVEFAGRWDTISGVGLDPLPEQRPIPMWIGAQAVPRASVIRRIATLSDGWFVLSSPDEFVEVSAKIADAAQASGRDAAEIGTEAGVAVVGPREAEWQDRVRGWRKAGLDYVCLRTLGGGLNNEQHLSKLREIAHQIPE